MAEVKTKGYAVTVMGAVNPSDLGVTMMHEHLLIDLQRIFDEPTDPIENAGAHAPVSLDNLSWVSLNLSRNKDNLVLSDPELAAREASIFKNAGGGTIVDVTNVGLKRDPLALRSISQRTGLHIVMGSSYYHAQFHPPGMDTRSEDDICAEIVRDITDGVGDTGIRAGIIGEVGCSWPLHPNEAKILRASARAQQQTGAAISIHPGRHVDSPFEILDILEGAGAPVDRIVMGHVERTDFDPPRLLELAKRGCYLEYDWFGEVRPAYPHGAINVPSDGERIRAIAGLIAEGFGKRIVVSQDVCFKTRLASYGGPGYAHIQKYVRRWMEAVGMPEGNIEDLLVANPSEILRFA